MQFRDVINYFENYSLLQVMLFFYMLILLGIFVIQFSVACACLAVNQEQELKYARYVSVQTENIHAEICIRE